MRNVIKASHSAKARKPIECAKGSIEDMLDAFENRIDQLENFDDIDMSTNIEDAYSKYDKNVIASAQYYQTDPRHLMTEEDMLAEIISSMLNLIEDYDMSVEEAADSWISWTRSLVETAKSEIESGNAKSVYEASTDIYANIEPDDDYEYYGKEEYQKYGKLVSDACEGMIISKRKTDANKSGGLIYEARVLGLDSPYDLLRCLEGMCYNGEAAEISDYQYKVL